MELVKCLKLPENKTCLVILICQVYWLVTWTWSYVAWVIGPKIPATPGWTRSHRDLLALKLSSLGYFPTSETWWSISYNTELWLVNQLPFGTLIGQSVSILNSDWSILPAVTKDLVSIDLSSLTAVTALWNDDSWAELVSSNNPAERATINSWNLLMTEITIESRELNFVKTFCSYMFSRSLQITSC